MNKRHIIFFIIFVIVCFGVFAETTILYSLPQIKTSDKLLHNIQYIKIYDSFTEIANYELVDNITGFSGKINRISIKFNYDDNNYHPNNMMVEIHSKNDILSCVKLQIKYFRIIKIDFLLDRMSSSKGNNQLDIVQTKAKIIPDEMYVFGPEEGQSEVAIRMSLNFYDYDLYLPSKFLEIAFHGN